MTTDADTWFSLIVNDLLDPLTIKEAILARLNINPMEGPFEYIHENGPYPGTFFCRIDIFVGLSAFEYD